MEFQKLDEVIHQLYGVGKVTKVFANGGDRTQGEVPEAEVCKELNIEMVDGLGQKIRSSSDYTGLK